jgi:hypothetical protein
MVFFSDESSHVNLDGNPYRRSFMTSLPHSQKSGATPRSHFHQPASFACWMVASRASILRRGVSISWYSNDFFSFKCQSQNDSSSIHFQCGSIAALNRLLASTSRFRPCRWPRPISRTINSRLPHLQRPITRSWLPFPRPLLVEYCCGSGRKTEQTILLPGVVLQS